MSFFSLSLEQDTLHCSIRCSWVHYHTFLAVSQTLPTKRRRLLRFLQPNLASYGHKSSSTINIWVALREGACTEAICGHLHLVSLQRLVWLPRSRQRPFLVLSSAHVIYAFFASLKLRHSCLDRLLEHGVPPTGNSIVSTPTFPSSWLITSKLLPKPRLPTTAYRQNCVQR